MFKMKTTFATAAAAMFWFCTTVDQSADAQVSVQFGTPTKCWQEETFRFYDPEIDAHALSLRQRADVGPESMQVATDSIALASNSEYFRTTLNAVSKGSDTKVRVTVEMKVRVKVPKLFVSRTDAEVQESAEDAVAEQMRSMEAFIAEHADKRFMLTELDRDG